jgi:hypothetical protein
VIFNSLFEVEHILPVSREGANDESNMALACRACNLHKSDHLTGIDAETQRAAHLFHPRLERWEEHFRVDTETGEVLGLTAVGRATVACLRMNDPVPLAARRQWIQLGIFP